MSWISSVTDSIHLISYGSLCSPPHWAKVMVRYWSLLVSPQSPLQNVLPQAVEDILQTRYAEDRKSWLITSSCSEVSSSGTVSSCALQDKYKKESIQHCAVLEKIHHSPESKEVCPNTHQLLSHLEPWSVLKTWVLPQLTSLPGQTWRASLSRGKSACSLLDLFSVRTALHCVKLQF